jgi:hypothetical protein
MSLRGKDFRCELDPVLHERLRTMADFNDLDIASFGAKLLEKAVCGEWHEFSLLIEKAARCGIVRNGAENGGSERK